jgi:F-type H+-transporting ATPase subunit b
MFEFEPGLVIWTSVSFGILLLLMYKLVLPPLISMLKERERTIAYSISSAEHERKAAEDLLMESNKKLAEAEDVARKMILEARAQGEQIKQEMLKASRKQAELTLVRAREDLYREKEGIILSVKGRMADLILRASSKVLSKKVDKAGNKKIVEESISKWGR